MGMTLFAPPTSVHNFVAKPERSAANEYTASSTTRAEAGDAAHYGSRQRRGANVITGRRFNRRDRGPVRGMLRHRRGGRPDPGGGARRHCCNTRPGRQQVQPQPQQGTEASGDAADGRSRPAPGAGDWVSRHPSSSAGRCDIPVGHGRAPARLCPPHLRPDRIRGRLGVGDSAHPGGRSSRAARWCPNAVGGIRWPCR